MDELRIKNRVSWLIFLCIGSIFRIWDHTVAGSSSSNILLEWFFTCSFKIKSSNVLAYHIEALNILQSQQYCSTPQLFVAGATATSPWFITKDLPRLTVAFNGQLRHDCTPCYEPLPSIMITGWSMHVIASLVGGVLFGLLLDAPPHTPILRLFASSQGIVIPIRQCLFTFQRDSFLIN